MTREDFKSVFDEYYRPLKNFLYYKLADIDLAEDITQEVFVKAWDKRDTILLETVKSYLYKIANNLAINHFNSAKTRFELKLEDHDRSVQESPHYDLTYSEIAGRLDISVKAVEKRMQGALESLRSITQSRF
jgi:DNA-directed RNA polymerase specialized sigma24 family protein